MIKRILLGSLLLTSLPALADQKTDAAALAATQTQKFEIDNNHTQVSFTYDHFGFSNPTSRFVSAAILSLGRSSSNSNSAPFSITSLI